jgi:hypothetical protein
MTAVAGTGELAASIFHLSRAQFAMTGNQVQIWRQPGDGKTAQQPVDERRLAIEVGVEREPGRDLRAVLPRKQRKDHALDVDALFVELALLCAAATRRREAAFERLLALPVLVQAFLGVWLQPARDVRRRHRRAKHERSSHRRAPA